MPTLPASLARRLDLTQAFDTRSGWSLHITELPGAETAVAVSFVRPAQARLQSAAARHEHIKLFPGERSFYTLLESRIVFCAPGQREPLLLIRACTQRYGNCSCWISTLLYAYDRETDSFHSVFFGLSASDTRQAARFIDCGPLQGRVVVVTPAADAARGCVVEVYKRSVIGEYLRVLVYCSSADPAERQGDADALIDAETPEILRRLAGRAGGPRCTTDLSSTPEATHE